MFCARRKYYLSFFIFDKNTQATLGTNACTEIGSIVRVHSVNKDLSKENLLKSYEYVFKGLSEVESTTSTLTTLLTGDSSIDRGGSLSHSVIKWKQNWTVRCFARQDEPTDYVHSLVLVHKPNKIRLCINPKNLNRAIKREHYHLKTVDKLIENLPQAKVFSTFDATHGFWHMKLDEPSWKLLAFNILFVRYTNLRP